MSHLAKLIRLACRRLLLWTVFHAPVLAALFAGCGGATVEALVPAEPPAALTWVAPVGVTWTPPAAADLVPYLEADCCGDSEPEPPLGMAWHLQSASGPLEGVPVR